MILAVICFFAYYLYENKWIVPTNGKEKTGYPTQKPEGILRRIITASSNPSELVLDFFAGSGTTGAVCRDLGREFILVDNNPQAMETMAKRLSNVPDLQWIGYDLHTLV